jgi:hypothetical protein
LQNITLRQGFNYWIIIDGFSTEAGNYTLNVMCPAGTNQATIQGYVACGEMVTGNSAIGTNTVGDGAPEHWWSFVAPIEGMYTFNTCGSS